MIKAALPKAARALLGIDQCRQAGAFALSMPTPQRMEASDGNIRGNVDPLVTRADAPKDRGVEAIGDGAPSQGGGRRMRLKH